MTAIGYIPGSPADIPELARTSVAGYATYRSFAPDGWEPPTYESELEWLPPQLAPAGVWCEIALTGDEIAGHLIAMPAAVSRVPDDEPGLGHLLHLFVRPAHWGAGVATALHTRGIAEARRRGFTSMRLFTPADQTRARRFYEREGWSPNGDRKPEPEFGMDIIEYRRPL